MSAHYLGDTFDIHGGGADLTFPHHENEIAQSQAATGRPFAKYWIHNGFINIHSEKMSKSLGNVKNIREVLQHEHPETLRMFLISKHYRSPLDYNDDALYEAAAALNRLYSAMANLATLIDIQGKHNNLPDELKAIRERFSEAMDDDFNTPKALAVLFDAARAINRLSEGGRPSKKKTPAPGLLEQVWNDMTDTARNILGLLNEEPAAFLDDLRKKRAVALGLDVEEIEEKVRERDQARSKKDFATADSLRDELAKTGIVLEDGPQGTVWKVKDLGGEIETA
jgi:cysteinyl-tRNA synthetase